MKPIIAILSLFIFFQGCFAQKNTKPEIRNPQSETSIIPGAERINVYLPLIKGKRIGIFANQTSMVGNTHLVDTLRKSGVDIKVIFGPEHGFRGTADAGEKVGNYIDEKTGITVVSLYGAKRRPSADDLKDIDVLIFDIQDVGVRFYTYISSLQDYMEAAFENSKPLLILDRPNPNGFYVDGPVLDTKFKSYVGMQPVPIVYGLTIGEYAMLIAGERWNLPEIQSIYLYPSTCLFEGTALSEGRGTDKPFQKFGHPLLPHNLYSFIPKPNEGAKSSKHYFETCFGWNLSGTAEEVLKKVNNHLQLKWLIEAYKLFAGKDSFFLKSNSFNRLAGNDILMQQIKDGKTEEEIRKSWEPALSEFKKIRKKYLLYGDFE